MLDPNALKIHIDGSAYNNPGGKGGYRGIIVYPESLCKENEVIFTTGYLETTNNRMELLACIEALKYIRKKSSTLHVQRILIVTDSLYVYNSQHAANYWKKNNWCNQHGRPVENQDLWKELISQRNKVTIRTEIVWEKGKSNQITKEVDKLAKQATNKIPKKDYGFRRGKITRTKSRNNQASELFSAANQKIIIRVYRYTLSSNRDYYKVFFESLSDDHKNVTGKYVAYDLDPIN